MEDADICCAANEDAVGVLGLDAEDFEDDTASRWVGNAEEEGWFDEGLTGASRDDGRRDLGKELGMESKLTAMSILNVARTVSAMQTKDSTKGCSLRCLASQVIPDILHRHARQLGSDGSNCTALDLCEGRAGEIARQLEVGRCRHRGAIHGHGEGGWVGCDLEHVETNIRELRDDYVKRCSSAESNQELSRRKILRRKEADR